MHNVSLMTHAQLIFCIQQHYPNLVHGRDFLVGQAVEPRTGAQIAEAQIVEWSASESRPDRKILCALWKKLQPVFECKHAEEAARIERRQRLEDADIQVAKAFDENDSDLLQALSRYRQALRAVPEQAGFPLAIKWPVLSNYIE